MWFRKEVPYELLNNIIYIKVFDFKNNVMIKLKYQERNILFLLNINIGSYKK